MRLGNVDHLAACSVAILRLKARQLAMLYGDTLAEGLEWHRILPEFEEELDRIVRMHSFVVRASNDEFEAVYDRLMEANDPENYDGGDAIFDAEVKLGINPWDVASHAGLMALTRAVSLAEITLARMAAAWFVAPNLAIFPEGRLWIRPIERDFFETCLNTPFDTDGGGFGTVRDLRDLYVHGYGIPGTEERRAWLAERLHEEFGAPPTEAESSLGYSSDIYFFGEWSEYSPETASLTTRSWGRKHADMSPLATYRILVGIRAHVEAAFAAMTDGVREELTPETSKFVKSFESRVRRRRDG